jgi:hypothetical protein
VGNSIDVRRVASDSCLSATYGPSLDVTLGEAEAPPLTSCLSATYRPSMDISTPGGRKEGFGRRSAQQQRECIPLLIEIERALTHSYY